MIKEGVGSKGESHQHFHHSPTYHISTIDGDGMRGVLNDHADIIEEHANNAMRKKNK
jgi:hypothetical protein